MIAVARQNAGEYGLLGRVEYIKGSGDAMPFRGGRYDAVFSNGSLHEWSDVEGTLSEMWRVLKQNGLLFLSDLRRDMLAPVRWFMWIVTKPQEIRPGLITSINAAYTPPEIKAILSESKFVSFEVSHNVMGLQVVANR